LQKKYKIEDILARGYSAVNACGTPKIHRLCFGVSKGVRASPLLEKMSSRGTHVFLSAASLPCALLLHAGIRGILFPPPEPITVGITARPQSCSKGLSHLSQALVIGSIMGFSEDK
jgi:hypothetical protein